MMRLENVNRLYERSVEQAAQQASGAGQKGYAAMIEAARLAAIIDVCMALRKDFEADRNKEAGW